MQTSTQYPTLQPQPARPQPVPLWVWLVRGLISAGFAAAILLAVGLVGVAGYSLSYRGQVLPGVHVWGADLGGREPGEAAALLSTRFDYPSTQAFTFVDGDRVWTATPAQLGVSFDLPATIAQAYSVGRTGNPLADAWQSLAAWYWGVDLAPVVSYDAGRTAAYLNNVAAEVHVPLVEASLTAEGTTITTAPGQIGRALDVPATLAAVAPVLQRLGSAQVPLVIVETPPLVLDASAQAAAAQAILSQPLTLTLESPQAGDPGPWTLDQATLGSMLQVRRVEDGPNAAHFEVGLNPDLLRAQLQPLAEPLAQTAQNARFLYNDEAGQLVLLAPSRNARALDVDASLQRIHEALAQGQHSVPLVVNIAPPGAPDTATAAELGITQLVSEQSTYFSGSAAERIRNIQVAGERFNGVLVPPGGTFSFNEHLGDVSLDSGFAEALIIYGGRTIRGVGGGVCQVSTTVFRAAYFGGYPIEERYAHAYRVSYYERGDTWRGPGLDATVYAPLVDFKFTNDTDYWLLMEVDVSAAAGRITWRFWSTSDGRQTTVNSPVVNDILPPPEPLYEENAELAAGQIKQVDWAAEGAYTSVSRVITRGGAQINTGEAPIVTQYQPWRAVFQYGPGTEGIPTPGPTPTP